MSSDTPLPPIVVDAPDDPFHRWSSKLQANHSKLLLSPHRSDTPSEQRNKASPMRRESMRRRSSIPTGPLPGGAVHHMRSRIHGMFSGNAAHDFHRPATLLNTPRLSFLAPVRSPGGSVSPSWLRRRSSLGLEGPTPGDLQLPPANSDLLGYKRSPSRASNPLQPKDRARRRSSTEASFTDHTRTSVRSPALTRGAMKQPVRTVRRLSYASPEAQITHVSSDRRRSRAHTGDATPFEEFQKALRHHNLAHVSVRRRPTLAAADQLLDPDQVLGDPVNSDADDRSDVSSEYDRTATDERRTSRQVIALVAEKQGSDDESVSSATSARISSSARHASANQRVMDFLITPSTYDIPVSAALDNSHDPTVDDVDRGKEKSRSDVDMHLYRATLNSIPLQFVVDEIHQKIHRDRMYLDLVYFIPFILVFTLYFIGRDISDNFFATAHIHNRNTDRPAYQRQVDIVNELFRMDTDKYDGNQAVYMSNDGTVVNDNVIGPQNYRVASQAKLPIEDNALDVQSRPQLLHWLEHVWAPSLWDCDNRDYHNVGLTRIGGNSALIGAARIRSIRVRDSCQPNKELWRPPNGNPDWDLSCFGELDQDMVDDTPYCQVENPSFSKPHALNSRMEQTTPVPPSTYAANETLFQFLSCTLSSTTAISEQSIVNLRHPCSGHYMTLPFQSSCNDVFSAIDILRPTLMDPVLPQEAESEVLRALYGRYNNKVPSNHCSAFLFHPSVRVIVVEYFSYSTSTDSFFRSRTIFELVRGGAVVPNASVRMFRVGSTSSVYQVVLQGVVLMFVINFVFRTLSDWSASKKLSGSYLTFIQDPWNVIDVTNNTALLASSILTALWWTKSYGTVVTFNRDPRYPSELEDIEELFTMQVYCNAVNVMMIYLKVLKFLRINDRLGIMTKTLGHCQQDIVSLVALFLFIHTGFAVMGTSLYGATLNQFRSTSESFITLLLALIVGTNYDDMRKVQPMFTPFFFWMFIVTEVFLLLNFFIAILGEGFAQVSQSMHLPSLDVALLRLIDEGRLIFRWNYVREILLSLTAQTKQDHLKALIEMHACLQEHLRLSLLAVDDVRMLSHRQIPMYFRDLQWWLPRSIYDVLGKQYLLILWENILYTYNVNERMNHKSGDRMEFARAVSSGVASVAGTFPDVLSLEVQAEVVLDKLEKLPLKIVEWSVAQQQYRTRLEQMSERDRRQARALDSNRPHRTASTSSHRSGTRSQTFHRAPSNDERDRRML